MFASGVLDNHSSSSKFSGIFTTIIPRSLRAELHFSTRFCPLHCAALTLPYLPIQYPIPHLNLLISLGFSSPILFVCHYCVVTHGGRYWWGNRRGLGVDNYILKSNKLLLQIIFFCFLTSIQLLYLKQVAL
jgi:hypothetical protein